MRGPLVVWVMILVGGMVRFIVQRSQSEVVAPKIQLSALPRKRGSGDACPQ
jgi:hypothetical protein